MKVEIWSDVMCPFCYIGKRHFEKALANMPFEHEVEVEWKSFQLNPTYQNTNQEDLYSYLSRNKGITIEQAKQMTKQVVAMAASTGIAINFDQNIPANSFQAHQLLHLAKEKSLQSEIEEALFEAHFVAGKDISRLEVLIEIAIKLGLDEQEVKTALINQTFAENVQYDIYESKQLGINSVPYFIFDGKYALSGAQPVSTFETALRQAYGL
jgi:protein disulfide-isomerase